MTTKTGYVPVNGLEMYYEIHGEGRPLLLLHGGMITIDLSFGAILPDLAKTRQVIAVEQQAHGHTADVDRPLTFEQMADDTAAVLRHLGIENTDVFGFSDGGNVALGLAIRHPELVRKLVVAGTNFNNDGLYPEALAGMEHITAADMPPEMREPYERVAPRPEDFGVLLAKVVQQALAFKGWRPEEIRAIQAPALVMVGDADIIRPEHAVELFRLLGGGVPGDMMEAPPTRLAILPGTTHIGFMERGSLVLSMIEEFLDAPAP
jgi:pimeloyl-ACP methyl ester carboxylesterase